MKYITNLNDFYKTKEWQDLRKNLIQERRNEKDELICEYCKKPILKSYDCIGHHKIELTASNVNDINISLNPSNIQLIHHKCHNEIHNRFGYCVRKVYLVTGSPLSGKSSWVLDNANKDDLIIDVDKIWQCISVNDMYERSNRLKENMFKVRDELLDQVKTRTGKWVNAYVVGSYPLLMERTRLLNVLGAEHILIDVSKEECIKRLYENPSGRNIEQWTTYIEEYWNKYQEDIQ